MTSLLRALFRGATEPGTGSCCGQVIERGAHKYCSACRPERVPLEQGSAKCDRIPSSLMAGMVIDASLAIAWVSPGHASSPTDALLADVGLGTPIFAPARWPIPVANALLVLERRKKLRTEERLAALGALRGLNGSINHEMSALAYTEVSDIASQLAMNVYDAVYLELALRLKIPLASTDDALRAGAKRRRVKVLP